MVAPFYKEQNMAYLMCNDAGAEMFLFFHMK